MIEIGETLNLSIKSIWRNKVRSTLTMLGIIIGVSAVILLISVGQGLQKYITGQFDTLGANLIYIMPGNVLEHGIGHGPSNLAGSKLTLKHVEQIAKLGGPIKNAAANSETPTSVQYRGKSKFTTVAGVSSQWSQMLNIEMDKGRHINKSDVDLSRRVAIIGQTVKEDLFGKTDPLGKQITVGDVKFQIIGVIKSIGTQSIGVNIDDFVAIPITESQKVFGTKNVRTIIVQAKSKDETQDAIDIVEAYMLKQLKKDQFSVVDQSSLLETINSILGVLTAALGGIAAISLVVGGVGIMNIMLVSVTERTREIGLRKAIGAKPSDILGQFVIEAVTLSVTGGIIGIIIGWAGSKILNHFFPTSVTFWSVALSFGVSALIGIIFGVAPAMRASRLDPIEALRYE